MQHRRLGRQAEEDTAQAVAQLETVRSGARWFALGSNFPLNFPIDALVENEKEDEQPAANHLLDLLGAHVTVRNGELWLDAEGRLNAWQLLRIDNLSVVLRAANVAVAEQARFAFEKEDGTQLAPLDDEESGRCWPRPFSAGIRSGPSTARR